MIYSFSFSVMKIVFLSLLVIIHVLNLLKHYGYLISKKYAVFLVIFSGINPRVADKMHATMARDVFKCQCLEIELGMMKVCYRECPWSAHLLIPLERDIVCCIPCFHRCDCCNPVFQVRFLSRFPSQTFCWKRKKKTKKMMKCFI